MSNKRYGQAMADEIYLQFIAKDLQTQIDLEKETVGMLHYSADNMMETVSERLDELGIYPDDIDGVFHELDF